MPENNAQKAKNKTILESNWNNPVKKNESAAHLKTSNIN